MENTSLLVAAMAAQCRELLLREQKPELGLPASLQPKHLAWMCTTIEQHADDWPITKLHRWIGFVQAGLMANQMLDLPEAKAMFDEVKVAYGQISEDLLDHLDPANSFELDIGGEG
jgi:hypothetical protein